MNTKRILCYNLPMDPNPRPYEHTDKAEAMPDGSFDLNQIEQQVALKIEQLKQLPLIAKAFELLNNLPKHLKYHVKEHTEDVFHEAVLFGMLDGLGEKELEKVATAAAWHDVGFLIKDNDNEKEAVRLYEESASSFLDVGYKKNVGEMIIDTKVHKTKKGFEVIMLHPRSAHLLDADLSSFGRADFWEKRQQLAEELGVNWENKNERREFLESTLDFIKNHDWHTVSARRLREKQKLLNIAELEKAIAELL